MNDDLPTIWSADAHTLAKHKILDTYLKAWMPILSRRTGSFGDKSEILFVDGFAGPGEYAGGEIGSPLIALQAALQHSHQFPVPVRLIFIENDERRCNHLDGVLSKYQHKVQQSPQVLLDRPLCGSCDKVLGNILTQYEQEGKKFGPALVFLDQSGYSEVPIELVRRILAYRQCEVFSYLNYKFMNRFMTDQTKWDGITRAYGSEEWKQAIDMPGDQREKYLLETYRDALLNRAKARYVSYFAMYDQSDILLYWLFFATGHLRGLEEMKKAMWSVSKTGEFRFSDKDDPAQLSLLEGFTPDWLAERLAADLDEREMTIEAIREHVLTETPCCLYASALTKLRKEGLLQVICPPPGWKRGFTQYPNMLVRFGAPK